MIGIIGYEDDVIGFGLVGIGKLIEMKPSATEKDVVAAIRHLKSEVETIIINESLVKKVTDMKELEGVFFIEIPEDLERTNLDFIEKLTRETLGISIKE